MADTRVVVELTAENTKLKQKLKESEGAVTQANQRAASSAKASGQAQVTAANGAKTAFAGLIATMGAMVSAGIVLQQLWKGIQGAMGDESDIVTATIALENAGIATAATTKRMEQLQMKMELLTGYGSDKFVPVFQKMINVFGDMEKAEYATQLAFQLSVAQRRPLEKITKKLTSAFSGNTEALVSLAEGIGIADASALTFNETLDALEVKAGGATEALKTHEAQMRRVATQWDAIRKMLGKQLLPALAGITAAFVNFGNAVVLSVEANVSAFKDYVAVIREVAQFMMGVWKDPANAWKRFTEDLVDQALYSMDKLDTMMDDYFDKREALLGMLEFPDLVRPDDLTPGPGTGADGAAATPPGFLSMPDFERFSNTRLAQVADLLSLEHELAVDAQGLLIALESDSAKAKSAIKEQQLAADLVVQELHTARLESMSLDLIRNMEASWNLFEQNKSAFQEAGMSRMEVIGRGALAFILDIMKQELQAQAAKHLAYGLALSVGAIFNPLLWPAAVGELAVAAALGVGGALAGAAAGAVRPTVPELPDSGEAGGAPGFVPRGRAGARSTGSAGSSSPGGNVISGSTVTINYNPVMVVNGNIIGLDEAEDWWDRLNRRHLSRVGGGLNSGTGVPVRG